ANMNKLHETATLAVGVLALAACGGTPSSRAKTSSERVAAPSSVARWGVYEVRLVGTRPLENPYTHAAVSAVFQDPDGRSSTVAGFYDGDDDAGFPTFVVRFSPERVGTFGYTIDNQDSETGAPDPGLQASGTFEATAPEARTTASCGSTRII